jgi:carboxylesterase type B
MYAANFVKTLNPNGHGLPRWPTAGADGAQVMFLEVRPHAGPFPHEDFYRFLERVVR